MVGKGIRGGICHNVHQHAKSNNKFMKHYDRNKESLYFKYWDMSNMYEWAMSQKLHIGSFKWFENTSKLSNFVKIL